MYILENELKDPMGFRLTLKESIRDKWAEVFCHTFRVINLNISGKLPKATLVMFRSDLDCPIQKSTQLN